MVSSVSKIFCVIVFFFVASPVFSSEPSLSDEAAIRQTFLEYKQALASRDGGAASELISSETVELYDFFRRAALTNKKKLSPLQAITTTLIKRRLEPKLLKKLNGKTLFAEAVTRGYVNFSDFWGTEIGEVSVNGDTAVAEQIRGSTRGYKLWLAREQGKWRINLLPGMVETEQFAKQTMARMGIDDEQFIEENLKKIDERERMLAKSYVVKQFQKIREQRANAAVCASAPPRWQSLIPEILLRRTPHSPKAVNNSGVKTDSMDGEILTNKPPACLSGTRNRCEKSG